MKKIFVVLFVIMMVLPVCISSGADDLITPTMMTGTFQVKAGQPMSGGLFYLYDLAKGPVPSVDKYWRVPDHAKALQEDGSFSLKLPEGAYCIGAIVRQRGATMIGLPEAGDYFLLSLDDKGLPKTYQVKKGERLDVGTISGARLVKLPFLAAVTTAIEGTIQDVEGNPVEGAMVFAFLTPRIVGKPLFGSERSSRDGKFVLSVPEGGIYYLKVRNDFGGGPPQAGRLVDRDKDEPLMDVSVETGKTAQIGVIKVKKFSGRGPSKD